MDPDSSLVRDATAAAQAANAGDERARTSPSGEVVSDFSQYCEGDVEPCLNKLIDTLIVKDNSYIVYLDDAYDVEWAVTNEYGELSDGADDVLNRLSALEAVPIYELAKSEQQAFRRMVGEAVGRIISNPTGGIEGAAEQLERAEFHIRELRENASRAWYMTAMLTCVVFAWCVAVAAWLFRADVTKIMGDGVFELAIGGVAGVTGGFLSFAQRATRIATNPSGGRMRHYLDCIVRSCGAMIGGVFAVLLERADVISLPALDSATGSELAFVAIIGIVAGASERLVPNLVRSLEKTKP